MYRLLFTVLGIVCLAASARGQTSTPPSDQAELVKNLLERIDKLEKRVDELERKQACSPGPCEQNALLIAAVEPSASIGPVFRTPVSPAAAEPSAPPKPVVPMPAQEAAHQDHEHTTSWQEQTTFPSMQIRGFGDVDFSSTNQPGTLSGFDLGQFTLHISSPLSRKVTYFGEVTFTAEPSSYALQVERTIIRYDYNDYFKLSFGKFHTPINYWNTAFHHGLWLQTTISRPDMIEFGGRFQPVHFVGVLAEGEIPSGPVGLNYQVGLGNGRNLDISRAGDSGDINNNRAWVMNLFARPSHIQALQVGGSLYGDEITSTTPPQPPQTRELISSGHIVWTREDPEFLAEFANVRHFVPETGRTFNSQAYYIQVAYRLPWNAKKWKPYYRFEHIHIPAGEPVLDFPDTVQSTIGVRYDITDFAAFKTEYRNFQRGPDQTRYSGLFLQTAFTF